MTLSLFKGVNGMTLWGKDYEIALYYLYMIADGELSPEEMTIFKSICQKLGKIDEYQNIITYCKGLGQTSSFTKIVDEALETEIEDYYDDEELLSWVYKTFAGTNTLLELEDKIDKNIKSIEESIAVCSKEFVAVI